MFGLPATERCEESGRMVPKCFRNSPELSKCREADDTDDEGDTRRTALCTERYLVSTD